MKSEQPRVMSGVARSSGWSWANSYTDIPGTTIDLTVSTVSVALVVATFSFRFRPLLSGSGSRIANGVLVVNGVAQAAEAVAQVDGSFSTFDELDLSATQIYSLSLAPGTHTLKLQSKYSGGVALTGTNSRATCGYMISPLSIS